VHREKHRVKKLIAKRSLSLSRIPLLFLGPPLAPSSLSRKLFFEKNIAFNIPFPYMIQIDRAGAKSFYTLGLFSGENIVFNIPPLLESKYEAHTVSPLGAIMWKRWGNVKKLRLNLYMHLIGSFCLTVLSVD
jgi:hypothetical protein